VYAYRVGDQNIKQNFDSDGDYSVGLSLMEKMEEREVTNIIWILTRDCEPGHSEIGKRRMEHATGVCLNAMNILFKD